MSSSKSSFARRKQLVAVAIAGILLTVIFVPFQPANAFEVDLDLPNVDDLNEVPTSAVGSKFEVTVDVAAGELISIDSVELILDNDESSVKRAIFNSSGHRISGNSTLARGNLDIEYSGSLTGGYGYGYGIVSDGSTFVPNYSFTFTNTSDFISGNNGGYSIAIGNSVNGLIGPGTITISGKLNTALMEAGVPHTLDILINTGTGVDPDHLVAPQLEFMTLGNSNTKTAAVSTGVNVAKIINAPAGQVTVTLSNVVGGGTVVLSQEEVNIIREYYMSNFNLDPFTSIVGGAGKFSFGGGNSGTTFGDLFDIDASSVTLAPDGNYTLIVPYNENALPDGLAEADVKLFHFDTDTGEWVDITTDIDTDANTVTGVTDSLSPIATGYDDDDLDVSDDDDDDAPRGGGGGGRSGPGTVVITWPKAETFDDAYFIENPLAKIKISNSVFLNAAGVSVTNAGVGQQISIAGTFTNHQQSEQTYAFIIQVLDENGFATAINWQQGSIGSGSTTEVSTSWTPMFEGDYTIKIFVWDGISTAPTPLSQATENNISIV